MFEPDIPVLKDVFGKQETPVPSALSSVAAVLGHDLCIQRDVIICKKLKAVVPESIVKRKIEKHMAGCTFRAGVSKAT